MNSLTNLSSKCLWILSMGIFWVLQLNTQEFPFQNPELSSSERAKDLKVVKISIQ
ncbi:hypothetical protein KO566_05035 [Flavobacteriaceae bacterium XHP0103]|uniref:hypothetical protein n=1 Tax=Marixanthotalea marina TaxID=2844359 RepID=UPI002989C420|nr:hypothetical protein [Marixanthotalea marina]MBU3821416.1 hypothetical protein [Marixanthotalea marina]